jgi:hypothetical protein
MKPSFRFVLMAILAIVIAGISSVFAASNASFLPETLSGEEIDFLVTPDTDDWFGTDYLFIVCYDANGVVNDTDDHAMNTQFTEVTETAECDPGSMDVGSSNPTATWKLFDTSTFIAENEIDRLELIEASPLLACFGLGCTGTGGILPILDGRLNAFDHGAPVAIYCVNGAYDLWDIGTDGSGIYIGSVSAEDASAGLAAAQESGANVLIASIGDNSLWALAPGNRLQLMGADLREAGKQYVFIFAPRCAASSGE